MNDTSERARPRRMRRLGLVLVTFGLFALLVPWLAGVASATDASSDPTPTTVAAPIEPATTTDPVTTDPTTTVPSSPTDPGTTDPTTGTEPTTTTTASPTTSLPAAPGPQASAPVAAEEPVPNPPPGVTITVNGLPMTGEEGGKIPECTFAVAVSGLTENADPATAIGVTIKAVPPMTPEGSPVTLVQQSFSTTATTWSQDFPMDALVAPFTPHSNGYHLRVLVSINGTLAGSSIYWLGCGQPQTGNPTRILFAVDWQANDGTTSTDAPVALLPSGWQSSFRLDGTSKKGNAVCTYPAGSGVLACSYDNPGHGPDPGLVVPGNPQATYDVAVSGLPAGWTVDPATVGTFVGRDTCPRGHHGEGDGDEEGSAAPDGDGDEGGPDQWVCTHTVRLVQEPAPAPAPAAPGASTEAAATTAAGPTLAFTGRATTPLTLAGAFLVLLGALLVAWSSTARRREAGNAS